MHVLKLVVPLIFVASSAIAQTPASQAPSTQMPPARHETGEMTKKVAPVCHDAKGKVAQCAPDVVSVKNGVCRDAAKKIVTCLTTATKP